MSRIIVEFYVGFINILLLIVYILGVILFIRFVPDYYFGVYFKWFFSFIVPFLVEVLLFGPLLLFVDMRNSLRIIEDSLAGSRPDNETD